jgi:hypothetical protein
MNDWGKRYCHCETDSSNVGTADPTDLKNTSSRRSPSFHGDKTSLSMAFFRDVIETEPTLVGEIVD